MAKEHLDRTDLRILELLQSDGRMSHVDIAARVGLSPSPCTRRIRRLESTGVVEKYAALVDPKRVGQHVLAFVQINDPAAPRYDIDRDGDGRDTLFGTASRNRFEEERALRDGLAPGQVRRGLRLLARVLDCMEAFCGLIGKDLYLIDPLFYHSAIIYERHGCGYIMGREIMEYIHDQFAQTGALTRGLDASTPFRAPGAGLTVRGRSWALHDGVAGQVWGGVKMYKAAGRHAGVNTFPGGLY